MSENKRKYTRLPIHLTTELHMHNGIMHKCISNNISFGGIQLELPEGVVINTDDTCEISLVLQDKPEQTKTKFKCKVIYIKGHKIGLQFIGVYANNYKDFVYMMVNATEDPAVLMEEISKNPGYEISTIK